MRIDLFFQGIIEAPKNEADAKAVNYMKDYYTACKNISVVNGVGYDPFLEIAGNEHPLGGWPMVQQNWDSSKFSVMKAIGSARKLLNEAFLITSFVYLDDFDVSKNVIYVSRSLLKRDSFKAKNLCSNFRWINQTWLCLEICI